ncbi:hypothetical protein [Cohnella silvisoli]|uniref:Tyrosine protein kinase n=1 Tax=Cohnella silvisoli TaxID=2873699 RepID=A0ABV1KQM7_9BACL|nr:hypothetical protein [Cohnella silvisoli]MCD9024620.1 hypothetical protein [Cohnella silvisoli]
MDEQHSPSLRSWTPGFGQDQFPGIGDTIGPPAVINPTVLPAQTVATTTKGSLPFNLSSLSDIKAMVDRMGGIEGVLSTVGKLQKFMATVQQLAPMLKLFMGKKGDKGANANAGKSGSRRRSTRRPATSKARTRRRPIKRP